MPPLHLTPCFYCLIRERRAVTKKEIVKQISEKLGMTQLKTKEIVQQTFDAIVDTLLVEKRIELRNFRGIRSQAAQGARRGTPGQANASMSIPSSWSRSNQAKRWKRKFASLTRWQN